MGCRVLICDDSKTVREVLKVYLIALDLEILEARTGDEGLRVARRERPDLVIADIKMPGMDGIELCALLRAERAELPVILVSAVRDERTLDRARALGSHTILGKPTVQGELLAAVRRALDLPTP